MGNAEDYFSVTCVGPGFAGCCHEEIAKLAPELAPLIALHLCRYPSGQPLHARANGWYLYSGDSRRHELEARAKGRTWYGHTEPADDHIRAARALNIEPDELPRGMSREEFERFCDGLEIIWRERAEAGRRFLEELESVDPETSRPGSVAEWTAEHGITVREAEWIDRGEYGADVWRVQLEHNGRRMTIPSYSKGSAYEGAEPEAHEILESVKLDAAYDDPEELEGAGYDREEAEELAERIREQNRALAEFLEPDELDELLAIVDC